MEWLNTLLFFLALGSPFIVMYTALAAGLAALSGWAVAKLLKDDARARTLMLDAGLGVIGFWAAFLGASALPWNGCYTDHGWTICNWFPYAEPVGFGAVLLLSAIHQVLRARRLVH